MQRLSGIIAMETPKRHKVHCISPLVKFITNTTGGKSGQDVHPPRLYLGLNPFNYEPLQLLPLQYSCTSRSLLQMS